jgi:hypothetical protein
MARCRFPLSLPSGASGQYVTEAVGNLVSGWRIMTGRGGRWRRWCRA